MAGTAAPAKRAARKQAPVKLAAVKAPAKPKVVLDLDTLSKQKAFPNIQLPKVPFTFLLEGVQYELDDPRDSDWKLSLQMAGNPFLRMRTALVGADDPIDEPTELEIRSCRERYGLPPDVPEKGSDDAKHEAELWPDGVIPARIDRFAAAYLPSWKLNALFQTWHEHYNIDLTDGKGILGALLGQRE